MDIILIFIYLKSSKVSRIFRSPIFSSVPLQSFDIQENLLHCLSRNEERLPVVSMHLVLPRF